MAISNRLLRLRSTSIITTVHMFDFSIAYLNENVKTSTILFFDFHILSSLHETCCLCMHRKGARAWDISAWNARENSFNTSLTVIGNLSVYDIPWMYWRWLLFKAQFDSCGSFHEKDIKNINKDYALSSYQLILVLKFIYPPIDGRDSRRAIPKNMQLPIFRMLEIDLLHSKGQTMNKEMIWAIKCVFCTLSAG